MSIREYIGARYVPLFMGQWDNTVTYEPLSIVMHEGNSYTSRQFVPVGIGIDNDTFWAETGNYNAQVEQYREEVLTFDERIEDNAKAIENVITSSIPHLLVIGDSWSVTQTGVVSALASYMGVKSENVHNMAVGGTGFIRPFQTSFPTQLQNAIDDASIPKDNPTYIVIMGGTNDFAAGYTSASDFVTVINNMESLINENFSKPHAVCFFMQGAKNREYPYSLIRTVKANANMPVVNTAWILPFDQFADNLHPNASGYRQVAKFIASNFGFGRYAPYSTSEINITDLLNNAIGSNKIGTATYRQSWSEDTLNVYIYMRITTALDIRDLNTVNLNLDTFCPIMPNSQSYIYGMIMTLGYQGSRNIGFRVGGKKLGMVNDVACPAETYIGNSIFIWS